ncbi:MAG: proline--tRNA ligase [Phycisphaerae bacterium]|nr:proline--tRNA ligase [Phycisphaerae bacterium]
MRYSKLLIPTVKEVPAEAEIPSHQLMIRAGLIRKVASGTYTYLPLGWRCILKIIAIVRAEMDAAGAQEISMPVVQPIELWQQTGRDVAYGETLGRFEDRHGRWNVLAPTAEEVVTALAASELSSYKQLPVNLYQINTKIRDEFRPRFGVLRSREFLMKDAYSFHATPGCLDAEYRRMYDAYCRIFERCGVPYVIVEAETGEMGGSGSHQFTVPCDSGEDVIVHTADGSYAANLEKAAVDPPADEAMRAAEAARANVPPAEEIHTPDAGTIEEVCGFLGTKPEEMIKTLVYLPSEQLAKYQACVTEMQDAGASDDTAGWVMAMFMEELHKTDDPTALYQRVEQWIFEKAPFLRQRRERATKASRAWAEAMLALRGKAIVGVVRGDHEVNEEKLRGVVPSHFELAQADMVKVVTPGGAGFAGPMGLADRVGQVVVDASVAAMVSGVTGANKTDYHVRNVVPGRDFPLEGDNVTVADVRNAVEGDTHDGAALAFRRGIEVGQVFKLGTKYSAKLGATVLDENGAETPCLMGCYGIGINRILASAIETGHDANGCILPAAIAPFEVEVVPLNSDKPDVIAAAEGIYDALRAGGADVLLDDRPVRPGVKFKDADLIGIPLRIVVGERGLRDGNVELKRRTDDKPALIAADQAVEKATEVLNEMRGGLHGAGGTPALHTGETPVPRH